MEPQQPTNNTNPMEGTIIIDTTPDPVTEFSPFGTEELTAMKHFMDEHSDCYHHTGKATEFIIRTGATGIGMQTYIKCNCCGVEKDVTDYDRW